VLDRCAPLKKGSHVGSTGYKVNKDGELVVGLAEGGTSQAGRQEPVHRLPGRGQGTHAVLLKHNGLHLDIQINRATPIGKTDAAGVSDLVVEAALSTILDLEDSVAAVDAEDKVLAYRNWLGILQGTLTESFEKGGKTLTRGLNPDREYTAPNGKKVRLHGRSPHVRAQRRPPDDQPGHPVGRRKAKKFPKASWTRWSPPPSPCTT
jgi:malate synthase